MQKKGQITIFAIIGIVIIIAVISTIFLSNKTNNFKTINIIGTYQEDRQFQAYVSDCVDSHTYTYLQSAFSNLQSTIYIKEGLAIGIIDNKPIAATKVIEETIQTYENKLTQILKYSDCLNSIPQEFPNSDLNINSINVTIIANDEFIVQTYIDGSTNVKGENNKLPLMKKYYGNIYISDFQKTTNAYILAKTFCQGNLCLPSTNYLLPAEINITSYYMSSAKTTLEITRENAIVADKPIQFNIELINI